MARVALEWVFLPAWILYLFAWEIRFRKQHFSSPKSSFAATENE
jgi:hypothetical protein